MEFKSQTQKRIKSLVLSLWIPEMSFVSLYHIYTVVFIFCCRQISLKYLTASYNPHFHPETNTLKILWQKQTRKYPTEIQPWKAHPWTLQSVLFTYWPLCFEDNCPASTFQKLLFWYSQVFLENQMFREPFQVNSMFSLNKSSRKNSHSFILDWKTPLLNFWRKKNNSASHNSSAPTPSVWCFFTKRMSSDSICNSSPLALLCYTPNPHTRSWYHTFLWGELQGREAWERKERGAGSKWDVNAEDVLQHPHTEHSTQAVLNRLSSEKQFVLRQQLVFHHILYFPPFLLPHQGIQSTPFLPYSSPLTC